MAHSYRHDVDQIGDGKDEGFEFGLHASYEAHLSREKLVEEKESLENDIQIGEVSGIRHHYLRFREPETWETQNGLFDYDSTLAWPDHIGYRGGKANPFPTGYGIWEIPLAIMDVTVFNTQRIEWEDLRNLVDRTHEVGGLLTYLWHNESMTEVSATRPWLDMYAKLTRYLKEKGAWFGTGSEIIQWAKKNWEKGE
jgi:hypothetical protein